jgi:capsular exopolysaccharide synthesis family protein
MSAGKSSQVIAVTSTVGGEGKTELCANLAGIISLTGKRVIILNLDMRKPTLHERFGLENEIGMSTVLSCHAAISEVIQHTKYKNLDMIASGPIPPNPSELIQSKRMEELIEMLRTVYPVIILDTPPVGLVTDARTLMGFSDISIYLLRAGQSKKAFLRQADMFFHSDGIQGFSVVLNDVKMTKEGYGYGYGYYEEDL